MYCSRLTCCCFFVFVIFFAATKSSAQNAQSNFSLIVQDATNGVALPGVVVIIKETGKAYQSSAQGSVPLSLPQGSSTLEFRLIGFSNVTQKVFVGPGSPTRITVKLSAATRQLGEVTVEARRRLASEQSLLALRRKSANIQDGISQEQIAKSASINTAQALQKVTGVTLREGKYITVRGLTDRNLVVELNGARLSGADAARSAVSLDLIPAPLLDNVVVQKSVTPDKPGDANGAVVELKTKSIPDSAFLSVNAQTGTNGNIGLGGFANTFTGATLGGLGLHLAGANLPSSYGSLVLDYEKKGGYLVSRSPELFRKDLLRDIDQGNAGKAGYEQALKINTAMRDFNPTLTTHPERFIANQLYTIAAGNRYKVLHGRLLGVVAGLNYYNRNAANPDGQLNRFSINEVASVFPNIIKPNEAQLINLFNFRENTATNQLNWGGFGTLSFRFNPHHEVSFTYNGSFGAESNATTLIGTNNPALSPVAPSQTPVPQTLLDHTGDQEYSLRQTQRDLHSLQLRGEHSVSVFKRYLRASWSVSRGFAWQNDPNYRDTRLFYDSLGRVFNELRNFNNTPISGYPITYNISSDRYYRVLHEQNTNLKFDLTYPISGKNQDSYIKVGSNFYQRNRKFSEISSQTTEIASLITTDNPGLSNALTANQLDPNSYLTRLHGDVEAWSRTTAGIVSSSGSSEGSGKVPGYLFVPRDGGLNSYAARYRILAFYGMADISFAKSFRAVGGLRIENTDLSAQTDTAGVRLPAGVYSQADFDARLKTNYLTYTWLPSGSLIYSGINRVNMRLAYSRSIQRPELNEAVRSAQFDVLQQAYLVGNNRLKNGGFQSFDFRTDFFPKDDELISLSLFYKQAKDVLERIYYPSRLVDPFGRSVDTISFRNNPNPGSVFGIELDVRRRLSQSGLLNRMTLGVNFFAARSTTRITDAEYYVISKLDYEAPHYRPLADQANFSSNVNLVYEDVKRGSTCSVFYNSTGKRLVQISADGSPNIYEFPAGSLDLIISQRIKKRLKVNVFIKNMLKESSKYYYTGRGFATKTYGVFNRTYLQRSFGYGAEYSFGLTYAL